MRRKSKMKITITGGRAEGKSVLALVMHKLLQKYTLYTVSIKEEPNVSREFESTLKVKKMKKLQPRNVVIEIVND